MLVIGGGATVDQTFGHTGRTERDSQLIADISACQWFYGSEGNPNDPVVEKVDRCLQDAPVVTGTVLEAYRGCGFLEAPSRIGPRPLDLTPVEGRYHALGQHALYLCDSELGVTKELADEYRGGSLYVQAYALPSEQKRIADLTEFPAGHILTTVFALAEECQVPGRGPASYRFSQRVAELVRRHFRGMKVPGVRGASGQYYKNVVVFDPHPDWEKWLKPESSPYRLGYGV